MPFVLDIAFVRFFVLFVFVNKENTKSTYTFPNTRRSLRDVLK